MSIYFDIDRLIYGTAIAVTVVLTIAIGAFVIEALHNVYHVGDWHIGPVARVLVVPVGVITFAFAMFVPLIYSRAREKLRMGEVFFWISSVQCFVLGAALIGRSYIIAAVADADVDIVIELLGGREWTIATVLLVIAAVMAVSAVIARRRTHSFMR